MSMVIRNNMEAVRTYNLLNSNNTNAQKHMQKVSTGMKLNSAQDDASAFAISERMRVRIRALDQAWQNTQNGSAMLKTAEGAVGNILETLRTLKEKAINSANDSNTNEDRRTIQKEFNQLVDQIDDDALVTFNGMYLINNTRNNAMAKSTSIMINKNLAESTDKDDTFSSLKNCLGESLGIEDNDRILWSFVINLDGTWHGELKGSDKFSALKDNMKNVINYEDLTVKSGEEAYTDKFNQSLKTPKGISLHGNINDPSIISGITFAVLDSEGNVKKYATSQLQFSELQRGELKTGDRALSFHVGAQANQATKVALTDMRAKALGLKYSWEGIGGTNACPLNTISISTKEDANAAIDVIDRAIKHVLDEQTNIAGALSRFEFTATNITTMTTNDQSSESVIRDADMATEMAGFIRYNVLSQTAQAMLAHANQEPNNVLALLNS